MTKSLSVNSMEGIEMINNVKHVNKKYQRVYRSCCYHLYQDNSYGRNDIAVIPSEKKGAMKRNKIQINNEINK